MTQVTTYNGSELRIVRQNDDGSKTLLFRSGNSDPFHTCDPDITIEDWTIQTRKTMLKKRLHVFRTRRKLREQQAILDSFRRTQNREFISRTIEQARVNSESFRSTNKLRSLEDWERMQTKPLSSDNTIEQPNLDVVCEQPLYTPRSNSNSRPFSSKVTSATGLVALIAFIYFVYATNQ